MSKVVNVFVDGSSLTGGGVAASGPSGWAALFLVGSKVVQTLGGTYRKSTSSAMEEVAFRNVCQKLPSLLGMGVDNNVVHTDYLAVVEAIQSLQSGKLVGKYADERLVKAVKGYLKDAGIHFSRPQKGREVVSDCGRLTVKWVKAHTGDNMDVSNLDPITLGNRAADKVAKEYAKQSLV